MAKAKTKKDKTLSTYEVQTALREKYPKDAYALLYEVRNSTGYTKRVRTADALVMGLWPSRGLNLMGYEIKTSRSDWVKEMRTPEKAEEICRFCDRWWLVVGNKDIVQDGELPETWGLMAPNKRGQLYAVVDAPKLDAQPMNRVFLGGILRSAQEQLTDDKAISERINQETSALRQEHGKLVERITERLIARIKKAEEKIQAFDAATGLSLSTDWYDEANAMELGNAVRMVMAGGAEKALSRLRHVRNQTSMLVQEMDRVLAPKRQPVDVREVV